MPKGSPGVTGTKKGLGRQIIAHLPQYSAILPCVVFFIIFSYIPIGGLILAFKDFKFNMGILGSPFVGFQYFRNFFTSYDFPILVRNTLLLGFLKTILEFPFPIILALLLNECQSKIFKRVTQTISYLPNFLSWVIIVTIMQRLLAPNSGIINQVISALGGNGKYFFMGEQDAFLPLVFFSDIWKNIGWNSIIYLAAISGVDQELYEAAQIDGAGRLRQIWNITIPSIKFTIGILFIMGIGGLVSSGFDQIYLLRNAGNQGLADTLDTYIIRMGLTGGQYGYAAAVGLVQGVVSLVLVITCNKLSDKLTEVSIW